MEKISTGVEGLDKILKGGLIKGRNFLLTGPPGSGKSTLALQYLLEGLKNGEDVLYISLSKKEDEINSNVEIYGWDLSGIDFFCLDLVDVMETPEYRNHRYFENIITLFFSKKPYSRVVFDSLKEITLLENEIDARRRIHRLIDNIAAYKDCTVVYLDDVAERFNSIEIYAVSGIIRFYFARTPGGRERAVGIQKMRGDFTDERIHPYAITENGINVIFDKLIFEKLSI